MVNVFVSYAHVDAKRVEPLVALLEAHGCTVWWDRKLEPGSNYEQRIEEAIAAASCVAGSGRSAGLLMLPPHSIALAERARSRSTYFWILPVAVFGISSNRTSRGIL